VEKVGINNKTIMENDILKSKSYLIVFIAGARTEQTSSDE
jgi:hypothetical protein